jgi:hypothetical protein
MNIKSIAGTIPTLFDASSRLTPNRNLNSFQPDRFRGYFLEEEAAREGTSPFFSVYSSLELTSTS